MIDFHSHIVYDVDDGLTTIEDAIQIIKEAKNVGFDKIILTPHYMKGCYEVSANQIKAKIEELQKKCKEQNINITLYQANEIYITEDIPKLLQENLVSSINGSHYVLFELPMNFEVPNLLKIIENLIEKGNIPIIAHPERYSYIQKQPCKVLELIKQGVLFQANYGSVIGQYGKEAKKTVKQLLKSNGIHFLGSDVHKTDYIYQNIDKIKYQLRKIIKEEQIEELTTKNAEKVIRNEEIKV